jgi:hypothetical protein
MKKYALGFMLVTLLTFGTTNTQAGILVGGRTDNTASTNGILVGGKTDDTTNDSTDFFSYLQAILTGILVGG